MTNDAHPEPTPERRTSYARRWIGHAIRTVRDWFQLHVRFLVVTLVGPTLGRFAYAFYTADPKDFDLAAAATQSLLVGLLGTLALFLLAVLIQLFLTPAALEAAATDAAKARVDALDKELADARATVERQRAEMDATRLSEIDVAHEGRELASIDTSEESRDAWLSREKDRYVEGYKTDVEEEQRERHPLFGLSLTSPFDRETRTGDEFVEELRVYFEAMQSRWLEALRTATIDQQITLLRIAVTNRRDISVEGLEVQVTLPADVGAGWVEDAEIDDEFPERPKMWGRSTISTFIPGLRSVGGPPDPGRIERVDGRLVVTWDRFNLSASARHPVSPVALFVPGHCAGMTLPVDWSLSSLRLRSVLEGTLAVAVAAMTIAPGTVLAESEN